MNRTQCVTYMEQKVMTDFFEDESIPRSAPEAASPQPRKVLTIGDDGVSKRILKKRGYTCLHLEVDADDHRLRNTLLEHNDNIAFCIAFPVATDLSVAGARYWREKRLKNPSFQDDCVSRIRTIETMLRDAGKPYVLLIASSPLLHRKFRAPRRVIHPFQYGGHLLPDDKHPFFEAVPSQDAYKMKTSVYAHANVVLPRTSPVRPVTVTKRNKKTGKVSNVSPVLAKRCDAHLRRLTPRGFLTALSEINLPDLRES